MSRPQHILIFGATGVIGKFITAAIVNANPAFPKVSVFTSPATVSNKAAEIQSLKDKGLNIITGDLRDEQQVLNAYEGVDTIISALGRSTVLEQIQLIKLAETHPSVQWFFPSEYGTDIEYSPASAHEKPHQNKLKVRSFIRENVKKLKVSYLVTGPYADMFLGLHGSFAAAGGFDVKARKAVLVGDGEGRVSLTTMKDVGTLHVAALNNPQASQNRILIVNSYTTTPHAIFDEILRQTNTTKDDWTVTYTPLEKLRELEGRAWDEGNPFATLFTLRRIWAEGGTLYEKTDNAVLGVGDAQLEGLVDTVRLFIEKSK